VLSRQRGKYMNYHVADFVTRLKNASLAKRKTFTMPYSKMVLSIARVLLKEGYIAAVSEEADGAKKYILVTLRYEDRIPMVTDTQVISKPSLRVYDTARKASARKGLGTVILSTNKGIMTAKDAKEKQVGGEVLFKIW